ncbi:MAG: hypothetical protein ACXVAF_16705 [Vulcanimicrobiaceae bacterium]
MRIPFVVLILGALLGTACCAQAGAATRNPSASSAEKAWLRASLVQSLASFSTKMSTGDTSTSDLGYAALAELAVGNNSVAAAAYLKREVAVQQPSGTMAALERSNRVNDANATAFSAESWGPILLRYANRLDPGTREALRSSARRALTALRARSVSLDYTNIALMQAVDVLLLGDALSDRDAVRWARQRLDDWIALTREAGIHEYDSPTYYRVDFDELSVGAAFTRDAGARQRLRAILDYFWNDVGVHTVGERFGGAHSRDYDFPGRTLTLHTQLAVAGLATPSVRPLPAIPMDVLTYLGADEVARVPDTAVRVAATVHIGEGRYTRDPNDTWYLSDNNNVLLGSADGDYGPIDKPIDVTFNEWISGIAVVPEGTGDPYGLRTALDRSGIAIPMHLLLHPVTVQQRNLLLAALDLDPREAGTTPQLTTSILLPTRATVAIDGTPVDLSHDQHVAFSPGSVVTVQTARAAVAIRVPLFEGVDGTTPSLALVSDSEGRSIRSARIVVTSYSGPARALDASHAKLIILIAVADGNAASIASDIKGAQVTSRNGGSDVAARIGTTTLAAEIDPNTRRPKRRTVNGNDVVQPPPLASDGHAIPL